MKRTAPRLALILSSLLAALARAPSIAAETWEKRMTQGKLAADLGDQRVAEDVFAGLAADAQAPGRVRAEALVRLGAVQRAAGKAQASTVTFKRAMQSPARDAQVTRLLTLAVAGVAPDPKRWAGQWPKVRLVSPAGAPVRPLIAWPGPGPQGVRDAFPVTDPVTFDLEDVPLVTFLHHLLTPWRQGEWPGPRTSSGFENWPQTYQPPAAVQRRGFVIHAGDGGFGGPDSGPRITVKASGLPWNELLENVLASNGLGFAIEKDVVFIARVEDLGAIERLRGRAYEGTPISLNFLYGGLDDVLRLFNDITGFQIVPDANLQGSVTMRISERPAMWVLDLVLAANDLTATRIDSPDGTPDATAMRIQRLAEASGEAVDLSRLRPGPPRPRPTAPPNVAPSGSAPSASLVPLEGTVQVKKAGGLEWLPAPADTPLGLGDLVRSGPAASAEIRFNDDNSVRLRPCSLFAVAEENRVGVSRTASSSSGAPNPPCEVLPPTAR